MGRACVCTPPQLERRTFRFGFIARHIWEHCCSTGAIDKCPVLTQNLPDEERSRMCAVLSWPRVLLSTTHQEPDHNSGGRVATVSLCWGNPHTGTDTHPHRARVPSDQWSQYSTKVQERQWVPPAGGLSFLGVQASAVRGHETGIQKGF